MRQLFQEAPPIELVQHLLLIAGFPGMYSEITREDAVALGNYDSFIESIEPLYDYYIPCKATVYLDDMTPTRMMTVLRQCCRCYQMTLNSREKFTKTQKYVFYMLVPYIPPSPLEPVRRLSIKTEEESKSLQKKEKITCIDFT